MPTVIVKLNIHETSTPIPNLKVTWFTTSSTSLPKGFLDSNNWESLSRVQWKGLNGKRLGSSYTGNAGIARMTYDENQIRDENGVKQNLWHIVQSPEIAGVSNCGLVMHVSCLITIDPKEYEVSEIRFPLSVLNSFKIEANLHSRIDSTRSIQEFDTQLKKVENGSSGSLSPEKKAFSKIFNDRVNQSIKEREKVMGRKAKNMSFDLPIVFNNSDDATNLKDLIIYDRGKKKLKLSKDGEALLSYKGITRFTNKNLSIKKRNKPNVILNKSTGHIQLSLPKVPDELELSETTPSSLFNFLTKNQ